MAKNQTNKNSKTVCPKLRKAINIFPFRKIHHVSHPPQSQKSHTAADPPLQTTDNPVNAFISQSKPSVLRQPSSGQLIPILSDPKPEKEHGGKNQAVQAIQDPKNKKMIKILSSGHNNTAGKPEIPKTEPVKKRVERVPTSKTVATKEKPAEANGAVSGQGNDQFAAYITRVRNNMRTSSELGIERAATRVSRRDSFNDRVTSFLNRAKIKMRTTTFVGDQTERNSFEGKGN